MRRLVQAGASNLSARPSEQSEAVAESKGVDATELPGAQRAESAPTLSPSRGLIDQPAIDVEASPVENIEILAQGSRVDCTQPLTTGGRAVTPTGNEFQGCPEDVPGIGSSQASISDCSAGISGKPSLRDSDGALCQTKPAFGEDAVGTRVGVTGLVKDLDWELQGLEGDFAEDHLLDVDWLDASDPLLKFLDVEGEPLK